MPVELKRAMSYQLMAVLLKTPKSLQLMPVLEHQFCHSDRFVPRRSRRREARPLFSGRACTDQAAVAVGTDGSKRICAISTARCLLLRLILRPIVFAGRPHHVIAVRDLQARKEAEQHIRYLAHHDALTSLPNRAHSTRGSTRKSNALSKGESLAVLCLDLDRFKEVNDLFGHAAGDTVLQTVASRVTAILGERQMIGASGGRRVRPF